MDLGSIFDLADSSTVPESASHSHSCQPGVNGTEGYNVHSIAIQVPKKLLTTDGSNPTDPTKPSSVIGVYTSASRQKATILKAMVRT